MNFEFHIVDVFSPKAFGGNQLAVVPHAEGLSEEAMQKVAREFNFAETTFILPPASADARARVRIFTPHVELPFAGHPVVGTAAVLSSAGRPQSRFKLELLSGEVEVVVNDDGDAKVAKMIRPGGIEMRACDLRCADLAAVFGLDTSKIIDSFTASAGVPFTFVQLADPKTIDRAGLDRELWSRLLKDSWAPQLYLFSGELADKGQLHARMFAPALGIDEDPATGGACVPLVGAAALRRGLRDGVFNLSVSQGVAMGRPSLLHASAEMEQGGILRCDVGGTVRPFATGTFVIAG